MRKILVPKVRLTGVLIEEDRLLLLEQDVTSTRHWSLPGGKLEPGETIGQGLAREIKEETGLDVSVDELLYVCDRIDDHDHVVHMTFLISRIGGDIQKGEEPEPGANVIRDIQWVRLDELEDYGFSPRFARLARSGFPDRGAYKGDVENIGL